MPFFSFKGNLLIAKHLRKNPLRVSGKQLGDSRWTLHLSF
jgi:hypothetical protein